MFVCFRSNLGWLYYGILKTDVTLEVVNAIGAQLQILYILVYFNYSNNKVGFCTGFSFFHHSASPASDHLLVSVRVCALQKMVLSHVMTAGLILTCGWLYFGVFLTEGETRLNQLGFTCSVVTIAMYLSPLSSLVGLIHTHTRTDENSALCLLNKHTPSSLFIILRHVARPHNGVTVKFKASVGNL